MIKFTCSNCNYKVGAPEKYAGKLVRCPKCKAPTRVPRSVEKTDSHEPHLIKFRCPSCNQKIGVTIDYAGKHVRCSKCRNPLRVPQASGQAGRSTIEDKTAVLKGGQDQRPANVGEREDMPDMDELLLTEASAPSIERPMEQRPVTPRVGESEFSGYTTRLSERSLFEENNARREPSLKKRSIIFIGAVCILGLLVLGIVVLYSRDNPGTIENKTGDFAEKQAVLLEDAESDGVEVALFGITGKNYKHGFIDNTGKIVIKPKFDTGGLISQGFSDGLARVGIGNKCCYIDRKGKTKFVLDTERFASASKFSEGLASVGCIVGREEKYGYIDKTGQIVIDAQFSGASDFSEGLARVQIGGTASGFIGGTYGYIDKTGEYVVEPKFDWAHDFSEGLACVQIGGERGGLLAEIGGKVGGKFGYIDKSGNYVIEPQFKWATSFSEGLAVVIIDRKAGFINKSGEIAIEAKFDGADLFSDGLACVLVGEKRGYIDKTGKYVIEPRFKWAANRFSEGLAAVYDGNKFGFIDKTGNFVIEPQFDLPGNFTNGLSRVNMGGSWGYIDKTGKFVWKSKY